MKFKNILIIASVALILFGIDFFIKKWIHSHIPLINHFASYPFGGIGIFKNAYGVTFSIVHAINHGGAWGIFSSHPLLLLSFRSAVILGIIGYLFFSKSHLTFKVPLVFILVGAFANVLDFFLYGHVVDLFYFIFWGYSYPIFNVADSVIFCSIAWIFFQKTNIKLYEYANKKFDTKKPSAK